MAIANIAVYAILNVTTLGTYGPLEQGVFSALPRWQKDYEKSRARKRLVEGNNASVLRPSVQDIITLLRKQMLLRWTQG